jgi:DNA invertase Pin-like site-specific DNA recombinase
MVKNKVKKRVKNMKYGYARVSTRHQDLEGQMRQLEEEHCDRIYFEKITGTKNDRPEFQKLLQEIQTGDTLVVTKLDRFARSTQNALNTIKFLFEKGVKINVLNLGVIENTSTGRLIFTIFSAFADFERDLIVERTQEGKEIAKQRPGFREGRPKKFSQQQISLAMRLLEEHSYTEVEKMTGISKSTLTRYKKKLEMT